MQICVIISGTVNLYKSNLVFFVSEDMEIIRVGVLFLNFISIVTPSCKENVHTSTRDVYGNYYYDRRYIEPRVESSEINCIDITSLDQIPYIKTGVTYDLNALNVTNSTIDMLPPRIFSKFGNLTRLYLSSCHIKIIIAGAFSNLSKLRFIFLDNNELTVISNGVFGTLEQLYTLNLANNKIQVFEKFAFLGLENLATLKLDHNDLTKLEGLTNLVRVKEIYLNNNKITVISNETFNALENLAILDLSKNEINAIEDSAFLGLGNLATLKLDHNDLTKLEGLTKLVTVKEIYLNNNKITVISNETFNAMENLTILDLSKNEINAIEDSAFLGLGNLKRLYLSDNNLTETKLTFGLEIPDGHFTTIPNFQYLEYLDLSRNPLKMISVNGVKYVNSLVATEIIEDSLYVELSNLTIIRSLNLAFNHLSNVDFSSFPKMESANLSDNEITTLKHCEKLHTNVIRLDKNKIEIIDGLFNNVEELYLNHNKLTILGTLFNKSNVQIKVIDFSFNEIHTVDEKTFQDLATLRNLSLQHNNISKIDPNMFQGLKNLEYLDLSQNKIKELLYGTFDSLTSLIVLDISNNRLTDLHQFLFNSLRSLQKLHFHDNRISSFEIKDLRLHLASLKLVSLYNNSWECKDLVQLDQTFTKLGINILEGETFDVENFHGIACTNEKEYAQAVNGSLFPVETLAKNLQKALRDGLKDSEFTRFFNEDFKKSKFFQYFTSDYLRSNFFTFLDNYKFVTVKQENLNENRTQKLTSLQIVPSNGSDKIVVVLVLITILLFFLVASVIYVILKRSMYRNYQRSLSSQINL